MTMTAERWRRAEPIFERALELSGPNRERYLDDTCGSDAQLRADVEQLLAADASPRNDLSEAADRVASALRSGLSISGAPEGETGAIAVTDRWSHRSRDAVAEQRLVPGAVLGGRFRIIEWIGEGGMGEVYRADDLKLGQQVALKFLPAEIETDPRSLERLTNEVRLALRVSHPNVTRVFDLAEVDGRHFVSMEYVDGEDLASLLRRIGRLPSDKAVEVARQICSAIAAAHAEGILHRDIKPANVMLDGRGQVKVTDFGLATLDGDLGGSEARFGTPRYMAPEQWAGDGPGRQSDLYSLALVLVELLTGRAVFADKTLEQIAEFHRTGRDAGSELIEASVDIDPEVLELVRRCLLVDPSRRPESAEALASALPTVDPLANAMDAGITPSPRVVAEASGQGDISPFLACLLLLAGIGLVAIAVVRSDSYQLPSVVGLSTPPVVLESTAQQLMEGLGFRRDDFVDQRGFFEIEPDFLAYVRNRETDWSSLERYPPVGYRYRLRSSERPLVRFDLASVDRLGEDPPSGPGAVEVALDLDGHLVEFHRAARSTRSSIEGRASATVQATPTDWKPMFRAAGLDMDRFQLAPSGAGTAVAAAEAPVWRGVHPRFPSVELEVAGSSVGGSPTSFTVEGPWSRSDSAPPSIFGRQIPWLMPVIFLAAGFAALVLGWLNLQRGRADTRTAGRLALVVFVARAAQLLAAHHVGGAAEIELLVGHLSRALFRAASIGLLYVAVEPYARRLWPRMFTSWIRLVNHQVRDRLVARDLMIGATAGIACAQLRILGASWLHPVLSEGPRGLVRDRWTEEVALLGTTESVAAIADQVWGGGVFVFVIATLVLILRILSGRTWVAVAGTAVIGVLANLPSATSPERPVFMVLFPIMLLGGLAVLLRVGILSFVVLHITMRCLLFVPLVSQPSSWRFPTTLLTVGLVVGVLLWGFHHSVGARLWASRLRSVT